jgi:lysophospholipase L1-like esterase
VTTITTPYPTSIRAAAKVNLLPAQSPQRIVCFGDSTTAPRANVIPYCEQLASPTLVTINRGIPGDTTATARARFDKDVLASNPETVIIQFGINDSTIDVWKSPPETTHRVPLTAFIQNLTHFIETLHQRRVRVILMTFNPIRWTPRLIELYGRPPYNPNDPTGFDQPRTSYLEAIRQLAKTHRTGLIDIHREYQRYDLTTLLPDGMHPNTRGHQLTANLIRNLLTPNAHP